jgi:hypothetical protein
VHTDSLDYCLELIELLSICGHGENTFGQSVSFPSWVDDVACELMYFLFDISSLLERYFQFLISRIWCKIQIRLCF